MRLINNLNRNLLFLSAILLTFNLDVQADRIDPSEYEVPENVTRGYEIFEENCVSCHTIGKGTLTGPDLKGITDKRTDEWLRSWIYDNNALRASGDKDAIAIFNEYEGVAMNAFPNLSEEKMDDLLSYLENPSLIKEESEQVELSQDKIDEETSIVTILISFIILLVVVSLLISLKNNLKESVSEPTESMLKTVNNFVENNRNKFVIILLGFIFFLKVGFDTLMGIGVVEGYQPPQPIEFSHKVHAEQTGADCNACHHSARNSKTAGVPSVNVCMNCHSKIPEGDITGKKEIKKIYDAIENNTPIEWIRVHQLPDLTYFNHSQHVTVAGLECQQCHGNIQEKTVAQVAYFEELNKIEANEKQGIKFKHPTLTMGWCIDCHKHKEIDMENNDYYTEMHEKIKSNPKYKNKKITPALIGGMECGKCHY